MNMTPRDDARSESANPVKRLSWTAPAVVRMMAGQAEFGGSRSGDGTNAALS